MILKKTPDQLRVGDMIVVKDGVRLKIDSLKSGVAGILCPLIEGTYVGINAHTMSKATMVYDTGSTPKSQDHVFEVEIP